MMAGWGELVGGSMGQSGTRMNPTATHRRRRLGRRLVSESIRGGPGGLVLRGAVSILVVSTINHYDGVDCCDCLTIRRQ